MHNATQPTYVLTDEKFKKVAKGVKARLDQKYPENQNLSLMVLVQALSQEMFSMPYEEAKKTVLSQGVNVLADKAEPIDNRASIGLAKEVTLADFQGALAEMSASIPLTQVAELRPYMHVLNDFPGPDELKDIVLQAASASIDEIAENWDNGEDSLFSGCVLALYYYASNGVEEFTLSRMREVANLPSVTRWLDGGSLPAWIKERLIASMEYAGIEVREPHLTDHYFQQEKFNEAVEDSVSALDKLIDYIDADKALKRAESGRENDEQRPLPTREFLDAVAVLTPCVKLSALTDLDCVKHDILRMEQAEDGQSKLIIRLNKMRTDGAKGIWFRRAMSVFGPYTEAYFCNVGATMQGPRFADLVAGFNLDNLAAMAKDKELPRELRHPIMAMLNSIDYKMDSETQRASTEEQFQYIAMYLMDPASVIQGYVKSIERQAE